MMMIKIRVEIIVWILYFTSSYR